MATGSRPKRAIVQGLLLTLPFPSEKLLSCERGSSPSPLLRHGPPPCPPEPFHPSPLPRCVLSACPLLIPPALPPLLFLQPPPAPASSSSSPPPPAQGAPVQVVPGARGGKEVRTSGAAPNNALGGIRDARLSLEHEKSQLWLCRAFHLLLLPISSIEIFHQCL